MTISVSVCVNTLGVPEKVWYLITHLVPLSGLLNILVHGKIVEIAAFLWRTMEVPDDILQCTDAQVLSETFSKFIVETRNVTVNSIRQQLCTVFFVDFYAI